MGNYPSRDSCTQASAVATTVCGIIHATLCKRKWHWAWICRLAPPTLSTSSIVQVPFLILLYIVTEKRRVAQRIIRLMWLFLKEVRAAITHPPRAHLKRHEPSILSLSYLSPVVNVVLEKAGLSVEICVRFSRASWQYNHSFNKTAYWCNQSLFSQHCFLLWLPVVFHYKLIWSNNLTNEFCDFWKRSLDECWQFLFRSGLWKKNSSLSCYWRNYGSTRSRGKNPEWLWIPFFHWCADENLIIDEFCCS